MDHTMLWSVGYCTTCHSTYLTTECCGRTMTPQERYEVIIGKLDFMDGNWRPPKPKVTTKTFLPHGLNVHFCKQCGHRFIRHTNAIGLWGITYCNCGHSSQIGYVEAKRTKENTNG